MILSRKKRYLQIALNSTLSEARSIISRVPENERIIFEAGTPLIKTHGLSAIYNIKSYAGHDSYIVADLKTMDRAETEVNLAKQAGASAAIALGQAPLETVDSFIKTCSDLGMDSMVDMMNIPYPVQVMRKLKKIPDVVILHRGVDEEKFNKNKPIPYIQINKILSSYNVMISIAGGDTVREVQRAVFNGANIVIVWKEFYHSSENTGNLAAEFLREIK